MSKKIRMLITIAAAIVFVISASIIAWTYYQMYVGNQAYKNIIEEAVVEKTADEEEKIWPDIDFNALYDINPDITSWLFIPDSPVSYPVLQGPDNNAYLRTTYDKKSNILGSIFQDYRNSADYSDLNTIVYGHNTRNDSMFGSLKKYKDEGYARQHKDVYIIRRGEVLVYEIFTVYETLATSGTYIIQFSSDDSFYAYIADMASQTLVPVGSPPISGRIVTLSTCTGGEQVMRLVLQAKLVEAIPIPSMKPLVKGH